MTEEGIVNFFNALHDLKAIVSMDTSEGGRVKSDNKMHSSKADSLMTVTEDLYQSILCSI
mgnify:CR=1 FL=1